MLLPLKWFSLFVRKKKHQQKYDDLSHVFQHSVFLFPLAYFSRAIVQMSPIIRTYAVLCLLCSTFIGQGQSFFSQSFRARDGLRTDFIKCIAQDSIGFIWIGSDDGLIRYDGHDFKSYRDALSSRLIKDFLVTNKGRLLVVHDLGLAEIKSQTDTAYFDNMIPGLRTQSDEALWYPKQLYEDERGVIWIAEPQSIVRLLPNGQWNRYHFGREDYSGNFARSFQFVSESDSTLLIASYSGNLYRYSHATGGIQTLKTLGSSLRNLLVFKEAMGKYWAGTINGLYEVTLGRNDILANRLDTDAKKISDILALDSSQLLITTEQSTSLLYQLQTGTVSKIAEANVSSNQAYQSRDETIWLSTVSAGVLQLNRPPFRSDLMVSSNDGELFTEALVHNADQGIIYVLGKEEIWQIDTEKESAALLLKHPGYFLSGAYSKGSLWVNNESELWEIRNGQLIRRVDFSSYGRYIFTIFKDHGGKLWLTQEAATGLRAFDPETGKVNDYGLNEGLPIEVTAVFENEEGLYVGSADREDILFFKPREADRFVKINTPLNNEATTFLVNDLVKHENNIWVASNQGLYVQTADTLMPVGFNRETSNLTINALVLEPPYLWFASSLGLFRYHLSTQELTQFNEQNGLPVNTVNEEGVVIANNKIWAGTARGVAVADYKGPSKDVSATPTLLNLTVNGKTASLQNNMVRVPYKSFVTFTFSSLTFPADLIQYSYRIPELDANWSPSTSSQILRLSELPHGPLTIELRAKKLGTYQWSPTLHLPMYVAAPFYQTPLFILLVILGGGLLIIVGILSAKAAWKSRNNRLERLVNDRTSELDAYKNQLEDLVHARTQELADTLERLQNTQNQLIQTEKMASLGILTAGVAHEINNPINFLQAGLYSLDAMIKKQKSNETILEQDFSKVVESMQVGVDRVKHIVASLSRFSRTQKSEKSACSLSHILNNCLVILHHEIKDKCNVTKNFEDRGLTIMGDEGSLHQLFTNLLSNAIHAVDEGGHIDTSLVKEERHIRVIVADDGKGIPKENLNKLYDPFFTTKPPGVGTGLGLYIAHQVVEAHHGQMDITSELGKGTQITLRLPYK